MKRMILALALLATPALAEPVTARVETGVLAGEATERAHVFRNVPYAAPPVGPLRWKPPARPLKWSGERDATKNGVSCPQPMNADGTPNFAGANGPVSEDCLVLNVFAPKAARKAPVMVWLHGGGNYQGAGWLFDGQSFARDGVVLIAINYRLGLLGYFAHPALTRAAGKAEPLGTYGLMDQVAALEWVKRNAKAFGGDPGNVTVFGESAGGSNTLALMAAPRGRGLFHKAIAQSPGGWNTATTLAQGEAQGAAMATKLGLPGADATVEALRAVPIEKLVAQRDGLGTIVDGRLLPMGVTAAFAAGKAADLPFIVGANSGEDSLLAEAGQRPADVAKAASPALREAYADVAARGEDALGREVFGDRFMVAPARWLAARTAAGRPSWLYHFSYIGSRFRPRMTRAIHTAEIQYVFEYWGRRTPMSVVSDEDRAMATLMHGCWVGFAKTGRPACPSGPAWPSYDPQGDRLMEFGSPSGVREKLRKRHLDAVEAESGPK